MNSILLSSFFDINIMQQQLAIGLLLFVLCHQSLSTYVTEITDGHGRRLSDLGVCKGLNIANVAEDEANSEDNFIMSNGVMSENWNGQQVNMATADEEVREFYIWKTGGSPIYFDNVTVFTANPQKSSMGAVISPTLDNDGDQSIEVSSTKVQGPVGEEKESYTAHLRYGRCFRYGQPYVWITFEAWNVKSSSSGKAKGYDLMKSCGLSKRNCKGKVCLRFTVLWAKQCPPQRSPQLGLNVGTSGTSVNVAYNGETKSDFDPMSPTYYILKDTTRSVFYINYDKLGGRDDITLGKPSVQGFADNQLMITQSGTAGRGVQMTAGGEKATLEINFQCKPGMGPSTQRISVGIDVCVADTPPNECSLQNSELIASQSIKFSFVKYCLKNPSHNIGWWIFTLFIFVSSLTCIYGCVHNFQVKGHRNIDIIPGAGMLREVLAACHRNGFLSACPCPSWLGLGPKYQTLGQLDEDEDDEGAPDGLQQDSSFSYQDDGPSDNTTVKIGLPRTNKKDALDAAEHDPFADMPVSDEDDLDDFLNDD